MSGNILAAADGQGFSLPVLNIDKVDYKSAIEKKLSIFLLNVQSLRNKTDALLLLLESCNFPDIVLLTEHWLVPGECFLLSGYVCISLYCRENSIHGGTIILAKKSLFELNLLSNVDRCDFLLTERLFEFSVCFCKRFNLYIICIYRPPSGDVAQFFESLDVLLSRLPIESKIILAGDLNVNWEDPHNLNTVLLSNLLRSYGLEMHIGSPTRITSTSSTILDYLCSNLSGVSSRVFPSGISDHEAICSIFPAEMINPIPKVRRGRIFDRGSFDVFLDRSSDINWLAVMHSPDPLSSFYFVLLDAFNTAFPLKNIKTKQHRPWYTRGLRISCSNLRCLNLIRRFTDNAYFIAYCKNYRMTYNKLITAAKEKYYSNRLSTAKNKSKETWSIVNELRSSGPRLSPEARVDPDTLNSYYCNISSTLTSDLASQTDPMSYLSNARLPNSFFFVPTIAQELREALAGLRDRNSSGDDDLSARIFLSLPDNAISALSSAINNSFSGGVFPDCLKLATVIPLHKGGDLDDPSNFRPISMLSTLSKLIERLVKHRVSSFLTANSILSASQFGFQASRGAHDAIFKFLENVFEFLNRKESAAAVFCDLSKAFDCVNHDILLSKLECYGFRGAVWDWFKSYLSGRRQRVVLSGVYSGSLPIDCGVPQGSVLGPLLFLLYVNDLSYLQIQGKIFQFADDTTIYWHHPDTEMLGTLMASDLAMVREWCASNKLVFNAGKTNVMGFRCDVGDLFFCDGCPLQVRNECRFLGLFIDVNLRFEAHILNVCRKLSSGCFAVRLAKRELGKSVARTIYFALVESHLRYALPFWGLAAKSLMNVVLILQKRAVRFVCGTGLREPCRPLFVSERILTLTCIFIVDTCMLIHKYQSTYERPIHEYSTRGRHDVPLPIPSSARTKRSLIYESRKIFNHLPESIKSIQNPVHLKKKIKEAFALQAILRLGGVLWGGLFQVINVFLC